MGFCGIAARTEFEDYLAVSKMECDYIQHKYRFEAYSNQSLAFRENIPHELNYDKTYIWLLSEDVEQREFHLKHDYEPDGRTRAVRHLA